MRPSRDCGQRRGPRSDLWGLPVLGQGEGTNAQVTGKPGERGILEAKERLFPGGESDYLGSVRLLSLVDERNDH